MIEQFDLIIPIAKNDVEALIGNLPYIIKNVKANKVHIIANKVLKDNFRDYPQIDFIDENNMLENLSFQSVKKVIDSIYPKAKRRTGWYFQQFLKLGYAYISETEYYMSWDSDTIPLRSLKFFNNVGQPYMDYIPYVKGDEAYFELLKRLWPDGSVVKKKRESFITEHMMFSVKLVKEMLVELMHNEALRGSNFYEKILYAIPQETLNLSGFSEFETYFTYVSARAPELYCLRRWHNLRHGKTFFGVKPTEEQLQWAARDFDVVSIEDFDSQWAICKLLCCPKAEYRTEFCKVYKMINPMLQLQYGIRMKIRKAIRK